MRKINKKWIASLFLLIPTLGMAAFVDVEVTHPNYYAITALEEEAIISGYVDHGESYFRPRWKINRAEALKILTLSSGIVFEASLGAPNFPDVKEDQWFFEPVQVALKKGIVQGYPNGKFHPEKEVTRAEFLKMLIMSYDIPFDESQAQEEWFAPYMSVAKNLRLLDDQKRPHEALTRGEVAEFIYRTEILSENHFEKKYIYTGEGIASYYDEGFVGKTTANGEIYDPTDLTAAHRTLPFGTRLRVWNTIGDSVIVRINDRGPYHQNRVLDLSPKAFEQLAERSEGLVSVRFEIYADMMEARPTVPEQIRPMLSDQSKNVRIPDVLAERFVNGRSLVPAETEKEKYEAVEVRKPRRPAYISGMISHLPKNFFPNATLRREIPQKIVQGTVLNIAGTGKFIGKKEAIVFLQNLKTGEQSHFSSNLSGRNFIIPVVFLETGDFELGLVFDDQVKSRIGKIEVVEAQKTKLFPAYDHDYVSDIEVRIIPEEERLILIWSSGVHRVTKIVFSQDAHQKELLIEDEIMQISLPFSFFQDFVPHQSLAIDLFQAKSEGSILRTQATDWEKVVFKNFILVPGFNDVESEKISVHRFPRFLDTLETVPLDGKILVPGIQLPEYAYLITPEKDVKEIVLEKRDDYFYFSVIPDGQGSYVLEIISDEGEVLFNRGMYFYDQLVLPITKWEQIPTRSTSLVGIRNWTNQLRKKHRIARLDADAQLNDFALSYAQKMAEANFISHVSPEGVTFEQRVKKAKLIGNLGENLSYGSTFELAMNGLENSASHLKNMLNPHWGRIGIGVARNEQGEYYVVQMFGE